MLLNVQFYYKNNNAYVYNNHRLKFNKPFSHVVSIVQISIKKIKTTHNTLIIILTLNKKRKGKKKNILGEIKKKRKRTACKVQLKNKYRAIYVNIPQKKVNIKKRGNGIK